MTTRVKGKIFGLPVKICFSNEIRSFYLGNDESSRMIFVTLNDGESQLGWSEKHQNAESKGNGNGQKLGVISETSINFSNYSCGNETSIVVTHLKPNKERE